MNKFLFITHLTPTAKRTEFRQSLLEIYFSSLSNQTYDNWKVILFGEHEKTEGKFNYFTLEDGPIEKRFDAIKKLLQKPEVKVLLDEADYIIKLDDDDIISPVLLEQLKDFTGDLYYDRFHTFIDSSSGVITQQERPWMASTCVHKKELILSEWNGAGASSVGNLLYTDHSKSWHLFYELKNITAARKKSPVYIRVLSPTSITSGALQGPPQTVAEVKMEIYYNYLKRFGRWTQSPIKGFENCQTLLANAWEKFALREQQPLPFISAKKKIISKLRGLAETLAGKKDVP